MSHKAQNQSPELKETRNGLSSQTSSKSLTIFKGKEKLNLSTTEIVSSSAHDTPSVVSSAHDTPLTIAYDTPSEQHLQVDEGYVVINF
ncbi:uncharacterized protein LOC110700181 isoform X2 [Chenopodium quinoa]|uniref:uncharacterized protein LOC110700181 isoform X2 n=1 Tax=Chenopodium quinoa TaxID=63459 RepID=UPI000B77FA62|nr:uncharacterized protein LOC110700181 isoform X2 [Chenopodium quinoa]